MNIDYEQRTGGKGENTAEHLLRLTALIKERGLVEAVKDLDLIAALVASAEKLENFYQQQRKL